MASADKTDETTMRDQFQGQNGPSEPLNPPPGSQAPSAPQTPPQGSPETQDEVLAPDASTPDRRSARQKVADLLWWSVPGSTDEEAKERASQLLDAFAAEVRAAAFLEAADVADGAVALFEDSDEAAAAAGAMEGLAIRFRRMAAGPQPAEPDTLPAWLYQRFAVIHGCPPWDRITDNDRAYWEHQARAVRRAVARGGFKTAEVTE